MLYPISIPNPASADDLIGYIDPCGEVVVAPIYEAGAFFSEGKAAIMPSGGKTGFLGANGQLALPFEFEGLGYFHEGLCSIGRDCLVGAISQSGTWIVRPEFAFISEFSDGLAFASEDGQHVGFIDVTGAFRIPARFETAQCFRSGLAAVRQGGRWGYLDADGDIRIPFRFDGPRAQPFTCGMAGVCSGGAWGFIDAHGEWRIRPQFDDIRPFSEGCAAVRRNNKWGLIDLSGT